MTVALLPRWRKWLVAAIAILAIAFYLYQALSNFSEIPPLQLTFGQMMIWIVSVSLAVFSIIIVGTIWFILLRDNVEAISWRDAQVIFSTTQFGKYIPGNFAHYAGRVVIGQDWGIPVWAALNALALEMLWGTATAAALSVYSLFLLVEQSQVLAGFRYLPVLVALSALLLLSLPWLGIRIANRRLLGWVGKFTEAKSIKMPTLSTATAVVAMFVLTHLISGSILKLQAEWFFGISNGSLLQLTCLYATAWVAGYVMPGLPGGLGVREAMMVLLLSPVLGAGASIALSITMRLSTTVADALAFFVGLVLMRHGLRKGGTERVG